MSPIEISYADQAYTSGPRWWRQWHTSTRVHPGSWRRQCGPSCQLPSFAASARGFVTPIFTWEWA